MGLLAKYQQQPVSWNLGTVKRLFGSNSVHKSGFLSLKPYYIVLREHFIQVSILSTSQTTLKPLRKSYKKQRQGNFLYILSSGKWVQCLSCMKSLQILQESRILLLPAEPVGYKNIHSKNSVERTAQSYTPLLSSVLNHAGETFQRDTDLCT